jgi:LPXTG-motif cell wall-anchored protein
VFAAAAWADAALAEDDPGAVVVGVVITPAASPRDLSPTPASTPPPSEHPTGGQSPVVPGPSRTDAGRDAGGELPNTGFDAALWASLALTAVALGSALSAFARRRAGTPHHPRGRLQT